MTARVCHVPHARIYPLIHLIYPFTSLTGGEGYEPTLVRQPADLDRASQVC